MNEFITYAKANLSKIIFWAIIIFLVYYLLFRKKASANTFSQIDREIEPSNLSYTNSDYYFLADRLYDAMGGNDLITLKINTKSVMDVINKMNTKEDFYMLVKAFGERKTSLLSSPTNLVGWFSDKLSKSDFQKVREKLSLIGVEI